MVLAAEEFLRRFLIHTLPRGFIRIRFFGFLANRQRTASLPLCRQLLEADPEPVSHAAQHDRGLPAPVGVPTLRRPNDGHRKVLRSANSR